MTAKGRYVVGVDVGGTVLTTDYLGGIFGLDGVHPTRTAHALIANAFIEAINARFGEAIPLVDVARVARRDRLVNNRFRPAGAVPFGVIAEEEGSDLFTSAFEEALRWIETKTSALQALAISPRSLLPRLSSP